MILQPRNVIMYPYVAAWFARCGPQLATLRQANFLDSIAVGGWVLDHTTANLLSMELPKTFIAPVRITEYLNINIAHLLYYIFNIDRFSYMCNFNNNLF